MHRRDNLAHFILAGVVVLGLTPLMVCVDAQAQGRIAFMSDRDWNWEIYVMDADGGNPRNLTNNPGEDKNPSWSLTVNALPLPPIEMIGIGTGKST